jgi:4-hydroxyacetophenone monooxygenase
MPDERPPQILPLSDTELRESLAVANVPTLLLVLAQLTGEGRWLQPPYLPSRIRGIDDNDSGGLPEARQAEIRSAAFDAIRAWRDGEPVAHPEPTRHELVRMLQASVGEPVADEYAPLIAAALGLAHVVSSERIGPAARDWLDVAIVGAGLSGICAAVALQAAGVRFTVFDRASGIGGTWLVNRYPGVGVDTPSHLYSFSFAKHDWTRYFATGDEVRAYLEQVVADHRLEPAIELGVEVVRAVYDETALAWELTLRSGGETRRLRARILISATGIFNPPKRPVIEGLDAFGGPCFHTAEWPDSVNLAGRRVGVIGNGATAMQIVPAVAESVASLTVFQRSPHWIVPFGKFQQTIPEPVRRLLRVVPLYESWYRARLGWTFNDRTHSALQKDPDWPHPERSLNAINEGYRNSFIRYITEELGARTDLLEKVVPAYPPFGKRLLLDNGWYRALARPNVELVTDPVRRVERGAVLTTERRFDLDVLVLATGFDVVHFLSTYEIVGRGGRILSEVWGDDARAYLGSTTAGFPNLFTLYGPNLQPGHGGSIMFTIERQMNLVLSVLALMSEKRYGSFECRTDVLERYNAAVDEAHSRMVWTHPGMDTYYRNSRGRVVVNTPFRTIDFFYATARADPDDYQFEPLPQLAGVAA